MPARTLKRKMRRLRTTGSGAVAGEGLRRGAGDRPDFGAVAHVQLDLALKYQRPVDHRMRADDDARRVRVGTVVIVGFLDFDAALDARMGAYRDVAGHGFQAVAHAGGLEQDQAGDVGDFATHVGALVQGDVAVDRFHVFADTRVLLQRDIAVDGFQRPGRGLRIQRDGAVDGLGLVDLAFRAHVDVAVDGLVVVRRPACRRHDIAVYRAGVLGAGCGSHAHTQSQHQYANTVFHADFPMDVTKVLMRRHAKWFKAPTLTLPPRASNMARLSANRRDHHAQTRPDPPRPIAAEPRKPIHRLGRRRPHRAGHQRGPRRGQ